MRKTTLSRSLLLTAALALGATAMQAQTPTYDANAPVVNVDDLTDGNYVLNIHNTSGQDVPGINATGLVYYDQEDASNQRRYRAIYDFSFENGIITDDRYVWTLDWNDEHTAFTLQNASFPDIYFSLSTNQNNQGRGDMTPGGTVALYEPVAATDAEGRFFLKVANPAEGSKTPLFVFTNNAGSGYKNISYWNADPQPAATSGGVQMEFFKVTGSFEYVDITYNYQIDGQTVSTEQFETVIGAELPTPTLPDYVTATNAPEGTVEAGTTEYTIDCTWEGPFAISESVQNATWYAVGLHTAPYYLHNTEGAESMTLAAEQQTIDASTIEAFNAQMWCFVGNPFDGFKIYNKAAGEGKILSSSTTMSGNGGGTYPILVDEASLPEGNNTTWDVMPSTNISGVNGFYIAQHGIAANKMNRQGEKLTYWTGGADAGSTFRVLNLQALYNAELGSLVSASQSHQGYVGALKSEIIEQYQSTIDALTAGTSSPEAYVTLYNAFSKSESTFTLTDGGYYRLHCAPVRGNYVLAVDAENMGLKSAVPSTSDASQIWKAVRTDDGKYKLMAQGYAIGGDNSLSLVDEAKAATFYFGKCTTTDSNGDPDLIWFFDTTHPESNDSDPTALYVEMTSNDIILKPNHHGASAWLVEEVRTLDVTMNTVGDETWATLYLPFSVTTPEGVTAYTGTQKDENTVGLTDVKDGIIPARTGVVLKGTETACQLALTNDAVAPIENNVFTGTCLPISVTPETLKNYYVLSTLNGVIGLYWPMESTTELAANKAFIEKSEAAGATGYRFIFGDDTTVGIGDAVLGQPTDAPYYDLTGRRVAQPVKGIYIHNGKKVFIK